MCITFDVDTPPRWHVGVVGEGRKSAKRRAAADINRGGGGGGRFGSQKDVDGPPPPDLCLHSSVSYSTVQHSADIGPRCVTAKAIGTF